MDSLPLTDLSDRAREIFRLVVEGYLDSGSPVGSKALAGEEGINLSPASIRSVLAELEQRGLLAAPHTSAGRMPTDSGLRLFVDAMMQVSEPTEHERAAIEQRLSDPGPIERALEQTSALLSDLSGAAGMVMVPRREPRLAQVALTALDANRVLAVLVGQDGQVENRVLDVSPQSLGTSLEQASNYLTKRAAGRTLAEVARLIEEDILNERSALDEASRDLITRGLAMWTQDAAQRPMLIVRGQANLLDESVLNDIERVRSLLDDLENKQSVAALLEHAREAEAMRIFIGSENRLFALSGSLLSPPPIVIAKERCSACLALSGQLG